MGDLLIECPIHLDAVSITDILVFKCGHGFCEPCLEEHLAHHGQSSLACPTCRKPVRRKEAFPLFLAPAQPSTGTQSVRPMADAARARLVGELKEAKAAHANCSDRFLELENEINTLRQDGVHYGQRIQHLRDRYEVLQEQLTVEAANLARAREECTRMKEDVTKLQIEYHKLTKELEQASKERKVQSERAKLFHGYMEQYKHKYNLEKKKRKAVEDANRSPPWKEDESLMIVDANAPDMLHQDGPDFGWLDEACKVKGDRLAVPGDEDLEFEKESEDELLLGDPDTKGKQRYLQNDRTPELPARLSSDWNLGLGTWGRPVSGIARKRRHGDRQVGGSRFVKAKMPVVGAHKLVGGPLAIDRQGHIKGTVVLGSRQKFNSKN